jgi:hypothetical protein
MKRLYLLILILILSLCAAPAFAATPVNPDDPALVMYATNYTAGDVVPVELPSANVARLNPENALGPFDASSSSDPAFNNKFFAVASRTWTEYTFDANFMNVDGVPDIEFAEVTWGSGNSWHVEAVKVYLIDAMVRNAEGQIVPYGATDDGIGYYAGIAWNRTGIQFVPQARRLEITQSYGPVGVTRAYDTNTFEYSGVFGISKFNLPEEVVCAHGIYLVDITKDVYAEGTPEGQTSPASTYTGNTDGYDLDAIRVYRCIPGGGDSATGMGTPILAKGNWFMYNVYPQGPYNIQAGNPKNGTNFIGTYNIEPSDGAYIATYNLNPTITKNGYIYDIFLIEEHLAISNSMNFTAVPGQDDNADFGVPFPDDDGNFYIFAHFKVEYR